MTEERGFTPIPNRIMRDRTLPGAALRVYGVMLSYAWGGNPCTVSSSRIADEAGIGRSSFWAAVATLKERDLIRSETVPAHTGVANRYWINADPVQISDDPSGLVQKSDGGSSGPGDDPRPAERTQKKTREEDQSSASSAAREIDRPTSGDDLRELIAYLARIADWSSAQDDSDARRFGSMWVGSAGREGARLADLLRDEEPGVRLRVVDYIARRARAGWTAMSITNAVAGRVLSNARADEEAAARNVPSREEAEAVRRRQRVEDADALDDYFAAYAGQEPAPATPGFDYDATPTEGQQ